MSATLAAAVRVVLYEGKGSRAIEPSRRLELLRALLENGYAVARVRPGGSVAGSDSGVLVVLGQFDGAHPFADDSASSGLLILVRELADLDIAGALNLVEQARGEARAPPRAAWKPWFPVIDFDRCTNCMQCLSFCLFDVYGVSSDNKIQVQHQSNCKTDCPACSRVCPEVAILFPKYKAGPINGDEISSDDLRREAMKVDISALLGGDIYAMLRDRSAKAKSRFSKERDEDRALKERQRCLAKLQEQLEVPPEVLATLPSLDQIQAKADTARARAGAALAQNNK